MENKRFCDWNRPMNNVPIKGEKINVPIWGGTDEAILAPWSEIQKLGFELRQRAFGYLLDGTPALFFMGTEEEPFKRLWFVTTETLEELKSSTC